MNGLAPRVLAEIPMPGRPYRAVFSPDGRWLYVTLMDKDPSAGAAAANGQLALVDIAAHTLVSTVICPGARGLALTSTGEELWIARTAGAVSHVAVSGWSEESELTFTTAPTIPGGSTGMVTLVAEESIVITSEEDASCLAIVDPQRVGSDQPALLGTISMGRNPISIVAAPDGTIFAGDQFDRAGGPGGITAIDATAISANASEDAVIARVAVGNCARVCLSHEGNVVWATLREENRLVALDAAELRHGHCERLADIPMGPAPVGLAVIESGGVLLVANSNRFATPWAVGQRMAVVDLEACLEGHDPVIESLELGAFPREIAALGSRFAVTNFGSCTVSLGELKG